MNNEPTWLEYDPELDDNHVLTPDDVGTAVEQPDMPER